MAEADSTDKTEPAAGETLPAVTPPRRTGSRDPRVFVLLRELSEVHLLLDHVSANPDTTVTELTAGKVPKELGDEWIEKVCQIAWPPDGSDEEKAEDAALLIRAKDFLNRLAQPASGSTIAFTHLVTQQDVGKRPAPKAAKRREAEEESGPASWLFRKLAPNQEPSPTRSSLAQTAYPDLVAKAAGFRRWMTAICVGLLVILVLTCGMSWYVAEGNSALAELQAARAAVADVQNRINEAEAAEAAPVRGAAGPAQPAAPVQPEAGAQPAAQPAAAAVPFVPLFQRPIVSATQAQLCTARLVAEADVIRATSRLESWDCRRPFTDCSGAKSADSPSRAGAFVNIMGSAVLPFFYGLLGAGAAIIRSLSRKIRSSLLSPRDLHLSFQQLALGAVVGACIGLFVASPGTESGDNLLGPITLSASAISFVAGFGVEAVFQALEALISRIFNIAPAAPAARGGDGVASN